MDRLKYELNFIYLNKNVEVSYPLTIYKDDTIDNVKTKLSDLLDNKNVDEYYFFAKKKVLLNPYDIYKKLSFQNTKPIGYDIFSSFCLNHELPIPEKKENYELDDFLELETDVISSFPIGIVHDTLFVVDPFKNKLNQLEDSGTSSNLLWISYPDILDNKVYVCLLPDVYEYSKNEGLENKNVINVYYPYLFSYVYKEDPPKVKSESKVVYDDYNKVIDFHHGIYNPDYIISDGITSLYFVMYTLQPFQFPLDIFFKLFQSNLKYPYIKLNGLKTNENIYRFYCNQYSENGYKLPYLKKRTILKYAKYINKNSISYLFYYKDIPIYLILDKKGHLYFHLDQIPFMTIKKIEEILKYTLNDFTTKLLEYFDPSQKIFTPFEHLNQPNISILDMKYKCIYKKESKINVKKYITCLAPIFNFIEEKDKITLRYKRVSNYNESQSKDAYLIEAFNKNIPVEEIIQVFSSNFMKHNDKAAADYVHEFYSTIEIESKQNNLRRVKINPGFLVEIEKKENIEVTVHSIDNIQYIPYIKLYVTNLVLISQGIISDNGTCKKVKEIKIVEIKQMPKVDDTEPDENVEFRMDEELEEIEEPDMEALPESDASEPSMGLSEPSMGLSEPSKEDPQSFLDEYSDPNLETPKEEPQSFLDVQKSSNSSIGLSGSNSELPKPNLETPKEEPQSFLDVQKSSNSSIGLSGSNSELPDPNLETPKEEPQSFLDGSKDSSNSSMGLSEPSNKSNSVGLPDPNLETPKEEPQSFLDVQKESEPSEELYEDVSVELSEPKSSENVSVEQSESSSLSAPSNKKSDNLSDKSSSLSPPSESSLSPPSSGGSAAEEKIYEVFIYDENDPFSIQKRYKKDPIREAQLSDYFRAFQGNECTLIQKENEKCKGYVIEMNIPDLKELMNGAEMIYITYFDKPGNSYSGVTYIREPKEWIDHPTVQFVKKVYATVAYGWNHKQDDKDEMFIYDIQNELKARYNGKYYVKLDEDEELTKIQFSPVNPILKRLQDREPEIFKKSDSIHTQYSRMCPWNDKRQPVILTKEEKERIDEISPGSYDSVIEYGTDSAKPYYYICPRYWDLKKNIPISPDKVDKDKLIPRDATDEEKQKHIQSQYILELAKPGDNPVYQTRVGFLKKKTQPTSKSPMGYHIPCCFMPKPKKDAPDAQNARIKEALQYYQRKPEASTEAKEKLSDYILDGEKFPLPENRMGHLTLILELFFNVTFTDCYSQLQKRKLKVNYPCLLRHGVSESQPFLSSLSFLYFKKHMPLDSFLKVLLDKLTLDNIQTFHNGGLVHTFSKEEATDADISKYRQTKLYKLMSNTPAFRRIVNGYENFCKYLTSEDYIDYTYLWDIVTQVLFKEKVNLIVLKEGLEDTTNNISIVCPTTSHALYSFSEKNPSIIIYQKGTLFEPLYIYKKMADEKDKTITIFDLKEQIPSVHDILQKIHANIGTCKETTIHKSYTFKENIYLHELLDELKKIDYTVHKQIMNIDGRIFGVMVSISKGRPFFVPCLPSAVSGDYDLLDDSLWNNYRFTVYSLKKLEEDSQHKIPCKPKIRVLENQMVVGILTETNQFIPLKEPEENKMMDELKTLEEKNHLQIDNTIQRGDIQEKELVIQYLKVEQMFYNAFFNTLKVELNDSRYINTRKKIEKAILEKDQSKLEKLFQPLLDSKFLFVDKYNIDVTKLDTINLCKNNPEPYCGKLEHEGKLLIPKINLFNRTDNEEAYKNRFIDDLMMNVHIQRILFEEIHSTLYYTDRYQLSDYEILLIESELTSYLEKEPVKTIQSAVQPLIEDVLPSKIMEVANSIEPEEEIEKLPFPENLEDLGLSDESDAESESESESEAEKEPSPEPEEDVSVAEPESEKEPEPKSESLPEPSPEPEEDVSLAESESESESEKEPEPKSESLPEPSAESDDDVSLAESASKSDKESESEEDVSLAETEDESDENVSLAEPEDESDDVSLEESEKKSDSEESESEDSDSDDVSLADSEDNLPLEVVKRRLEKIEENKREENKNSIKSNDVSLESEAPNLEPVELYDVPNLEPVNVPSSKESDSESDSESESESDSLEVLQRNISANKRSPTPEVKKAEAYVERAKQLYRKNRSPANEEVLLQAQEHLHELQPKKIKKFKKIEEDIIPCIKTFYFKKNSKWKKYFPERTIGFRIMKGKTYTTAVPDVMCNFMMALQILKTYKEAYATITIRDLKDMLITSYRHLSESIEVLEKKFKREKKRYKKWEDIQLESYPFTQLDLIVLMIEYKLPVVVFIQAKNKIKLLTYDTDDTFKYYIKMKKKDVFMFFIYDRDFRIERIDMEALYQAERDIVHLNDPEQRTAYFSKY